MRLQNNIVDNSILLDMKINIANIIDGYGQECFGVGLTLAPIIHFLKTEHNIYPTQIDHKKYQININNEIFYLLEESDGVLFILKQ